MTPLFLIIIYLAFISLGLPDAVLGAAWPAMRRDIYASLEAAGYISLTITVCTVFSSLTSASVIKRFGTGLVTLVSVMLTALALFGFSESRSLFWLIASAIPLGIGAGAVDAALNNYVASHYKAKHMNWLHGFWGVGAMLGPIILAHSLIRGHSWQGGYFTIALIQTGLVILLLVTLPSWNRIKSIHKPSGDGTLFSSSDIKDANRDMLKIKGVKYSLIAFFFYCAAETSTGLWGSSYLVSMKGISIAQAAQWIAFFYAGITAGRFITGLISIKINSRVMIRFGQIIALTGALSLLSPLPTYVSLIGFILIGLGLAPIFPSMLHETPARFGKSHSARVIGLQMALAYTGSTLMPPLLGLLAARISIGIFVYLVIACIISMFLASEAINRRRTYRGNLPVIVER